MSNTIIVTGNLTRDPELKFSTQATPIVSFGLADNRRWKQGDEWKEETTFFNVVAFGDMAENIAASLEKGARVTIEGRVTVRDWEDRDGNKRTTVEIVANEIGPSLRWATASVARTERTGGTSGSNQAPPADLGPEEPF